ncbi:ankyrin repeat-containing protein BDA1-like [Papaver somniferum]|uniref:ankyrin repeat-containing protein BDA1-like n=1 Tax=Papaver somniferum TaxID=3469 RepID=UPI000E6FBA98|nr:ankyrin repeat-containing protein BDA1-like [Papaver somniferum]
MERKLYEASMRGDVTSLKELLEEDPMLLIRVIISFEYENPLGIAAMCGHVEFAAQILRMKPELATHSDQKGLCPLHLAAQGNSVSMVKVLIEANPDVCGFTDQDGRRPLHLAAMKDRTEIVKILIQKQPKAIQMLSEYRSETILHLCVKHNGLDALKLLVDKLRNQHVNEESIFLASEGENKGSISVNSKDADGNTILHLAVARRNMKIIKYLLNSDTGLVEQNAVNNKGFTAMDILIKSDQRELKDMEVQDILREAGVLQSDVLQQFTGSQQDDQLPENRPKDEINITKGKYKLDEKYEAWLKDNKNSLMVVSSLIATMAFQGALNPPGGVWQETKELHNDGSITAVDPNYSVTANISEYRSLIDPDFLGYLYAGSAVMSLEHMVAYIFYMIFISLGFFAAMCVIFLLLSGFHFKRKILGRFFVRLLIAVLWSVVTFMTIAYFLSLQAFVPPGRYDVRQVLVFFNTEAFGIALFAWLGLMGLIMFVHIIRFIIWLLRKLRILKKRDAESG